MFLLIDVRESSKAPVNVVLSAYREASKLVNLKGNPVDLVARRQTVIKTHNLLICIILNISLRSSNRKIYGLALCIGLEI